MPGTARPQSKGCRVPKPLPRRQKQDLPETAGLGPTIEPRSPPERRDDADYRYRGPAQCSPGGTVPDSPAGWPLSSSTTGPGFLGPSPPGGIGPGACVSYLRSVAS